jgi:hypothetical protein
MLHLNDLCNAVILAPRKEGEERWTTQITVNKMQRAKACQETHFSKLF